LKTDRSPFDTLRANGADDEAVEEFSFVLSLSKHENFFFSNLLEVPVSPLGLSISFGLIVLFALSGAQAVRSADVLQLGYTNAQGAKIPLFLGKDQGIFEKHGIDLRLGRVSPGTLGVPKLLSGEIDLFLGNSGPVVEAIAVKEALLVVIASLGAERFAIYARAEITSVKDLKGKTFGVSTPGASQDRIAARALKKLGFEPGRDVRVVATGLGSSVDRLRALAKGEVDAVAATADDLFQLDASESAKVMKLVELSEIGIYVSGSDISAARAFVETHRDRLRRFLRALEESLRLARERPDLLGEAYKKHLGISDPRLLEIKVKDYYDGNPPLRPLPDQKAIESHIEELTEKYPHLRPREASAYMDGSLN
jgi:NitT/TauT family transport system substrate-binding protein